ncbi:hypothetical protein AQUCO_00200516v1 [Aquilegia coerulea]|uniref:WRKY domain-containing protein n=1 Tax=Aquilegia coerulea TaxID=218851 RepID=A0A2G5F3H8_AQUCA|nr:hypothetical protein AQUCO_00200516v1 [Aquilegia coerulea]
MEETKKRSSTAEGILVKEEYKVESYIEALGKEDQLEHVKAKVYALREENERLKTLLDHATKEYQTLKMHIFDIVQQDEQAKKSVHTISSTLHQVEEPHDLVFLSLGRSSSVIRKEDASHNSNKSREGLDVKERLALSLDSKFEVLNSCQTTETMSNPSLGNISSDSKEDETTEQWTRSARNLKTKKDEEDDVQPQTQSKKTRVSVRARCDAATMNDGCQWRKYGQKISKGNPCPRAYYRCTVGPTCPVRKQVQRCVEDMSILITTYEGTHNHPLSMSATAMASSTSAAASMLTSGSTSSSRSFPGTSLIPNTSNNPHSLNFNLSDNYRSRPQLYVPNNSSFSSHPTITLDLTAPSASSCSLYTPSQFNKYPPANTGFSSNSTIPTAWNSQLYTGYGNNKSLIGTGTQNQEYTYAPNSRNQIHPQQPLSAENITKAITSDPSFRTALEAAISTIVGGGGVDGINPGKQVYLNNTTSSSLKPDHDQQGSLLFLSPPS